MLGKLREFEIDFQRAEVYIDLIRLLLIRLILVGQIRLHEMRIAELKFLGPNLREI